MNVGFYYHVGSVTESGAVAAPAHMTMFVEELARQAGRVTFFGHADPPTNSDDTILSPPLVRGVSLGPRRSASARLLQPRLRGFDPAQEGVDVLLVRGPTPLLPGLARASSPVPMAFLLVGDYEDWTPSAARPRWRNALVARWVRLYARRERRAIQGTLVLANSPLLARKHARGGAEVREVFTSSLSQRDLEALTGLAPAMRGEKKSRQDPVRLLCTGRVAHEKGLVEAVDAVDQLLRRGWNICLDVIGPIDDEPFAQYLRARIRDAGITERIVLHGHRRAGPELLEAYLAADVFLVPSVVDAFPRSLFEAAAAGLPLVATRVGSIPERLEDGRTALLVEPGNSRELADAIDRLLTDSDLRTRLAREARGWAETFTNERSCALILDHLRAWVAKCRAVTAQTSKRAS